MRVYECACACVRACGCDHVLAAKRQDHRRGSPAVPQVQLVTQTHARACPHTHTGHVAGVEAFVNSTENKTRVDEPRDHQYVSGVLWVGVGRCRRFVDGGHE